MYVHVDASARIVKTTCIQTFSDNSSVPVPETSTPTSYVTARRTTCRAASGKRRRLPYHASRAGINIQICIYIYTYMYIYIYIYIVTYIYICIYI